MKTDYHYGIEEFVICLGYKGYMINTNTGGRSKRVKRFVEDGAFCMTYGDVDTLREKNKLEALWASDKTPWLVWAQTE